MSKYDACDFYLKMNSSNKKVEFTFSAPNIVSKAECMRNTIERFGCKLNDVASERRHS